MTDDATVEAHVREVLRVAAAGYRPDKRPSAARKFAIPALAAMLVIAAVGVAIVSRERGGEAPEVITADGPQDRPVTEGTGEVAEPTSDEELILVPPTPEPGETVAVWFPDGLPTFGTDGLELRRWNGAAWGDDVLAPEPGTVFGLAGRIGFGEPLLLPEDLEIGRWRLCGVIPDGSDEVVQCASFTIGEDTAERGRFLDDTIPLAELEANVPTTEGPPLDALLAEDAVVAVVEIIGTSPDGIRRTDPEDPGVVELDDRITVAALRTLDGILPVSITEINHPAVVELGDGTVQRLPLPPTGDLGTALAAIETGETLTVLIGLTPDPADPDRWRIVRPDLVTIVDGPRDRSLPPLVDNNVVDRFCDELGGGTVCRERIDDLADPTVDAIADPTALDELTAGSCGAGGAPGERWALCVVPLGGRQAVVGRDLDGAELTVQVQIGSVPAFFPLDSPPGVATVVDTEVDRYVVLRDGIEVGGVSGSALLTDG